MSTTAPLVPQATMVADTVNKRHGLLELNIVKDRQMALAVEDVPAQHCRVQLVLQDLLAKEANKERTAPVEKTVRTD